LVKETAIAGCAGGFTVPGVTTVPSQMPQCNRVAGNNSANANGNGCSIEDLCAAGWHVCMGAAEVASSASTDKCDDTVNGFWLTRQSQDAAPDDKCGPAPDTNNNVVGCGNIGTATQMANGDDCAPLDRVMHDTDCTIPSTWSCPGMEAASIVHTGATQGGVLCCKG
jgi:hypothetical protein